ncbi:ABC transporter permease [Lapidilactobacillus gannanensis]|jgi:putative ABC transport system permease protein|uniref:ABC transporter permease n=1 Tax=Lapidilactobacillus gannanensis TaxID=2486002 RepID=A0ABW4BM12_9LACO|nr:iron export ABC transporter permease subunit FetB [Lapidilactobacillus gannanensis]MCH4056580.1 iron export ABC transporter permease subunit FetB [Lactobacillaceae bacterium]
MKQLVVNNASLALAFMLVLVAMIISTKEKLHLAKDIIYSIIRAVIQLTIIGYVLKYIFQLNNAWLTILMCLLIVVNASWNAYKRNPNAHHHFREYLETFLALFISTFVTLGLIILSGSLKLIPSQIIPITGMIAGNSMVAVGLCYRALNSQFRDQRQQILEKLALGAEIKTASLPILRESIKTAMQPTIDQAKTVGLVNLPGMMSGLIFAGVDPVRAIRYQILITFMLLSTTSLGAIIAGYQAYRHYFNSQQQLTESD